MQSECFFFIILSRNRQKYSYSIDTSSGLTPIGGTTVATALGKATDPLAIMHLAFRKAIVPIGYKQ